LKFERLLETLLATAPLGFRAFVYSVPAWLQQKLHVRREIRRGLGARIRRQIVFAEHHESHAASAYFPSPFEEAAILTLDGVGEWATASIGAGRGNRLALSHELRFPHSPGMLYSAFTQFCGFRVNSGEHKLMGLAPYGEPKYAELILDRLVDLKPDGSFRLDMRYFNYHRGLTTISRRFERLFGGPPREPESPITRRELDVAASIQHVTEEILLRAARHVHAQTSMKNLCLAGGVALNCVANGRLVREGPFERVWVQPAAGDAGGALGVAQLIWYQLLDNPRPPQPADSQRGTLLGPSFGDDEIKRFLDREHAEYVAAASDGELCDHVADLLADGKVIGWFQGRMEFGPRALGARSILADPRRAGMRAILNEKIKLRESFRPFAPAVLAERAGEYFDMPAGTDWPYMSFVAKVREAHRVSACGGDEPTGLARLDSLRSNIPAVTHVDFSARVQMVDRHRHGRFYHLLERFAAKTGCPVVVNTSFNVRGEPMVCTPQEAYRCFMATGMDALVLERYILLKQQADATGPGGLAYQSQFALD
jgi:carbamoyltransferase